MTSALERVNGLWSGWLVAGAVEVGEPVERFGGGVVAVGEIEAVQIAERFPCGFEPWVLGEQRVETSAVRVGLRRLSGPWLSLNPPIGCWWVRGSRAGVGLDRFGSGRVVGGCLRACWVRGGGVVRGCRRWVCVGASVPGGAV